jgi:hypothetical protein
MFVGGLGIAEAARNSGDKPVLITINPCRLVDTRPATQVGPRRAPIPAKQAYTVSARGKQGRCNIPSDAIGLSTNVTAVNASRQTNVRLYPADQPLPDVSNLNPSPNSPPAWNAVTTDLSSAGQFKIYNWSGSVDMIVDINGYYVDHTHDDRYFTEAEVTNGFNTVNGELAKKANASQVYTKTQVNAGLDQKANKSDVYTKAEANAGLATKANAADVYTKAEATAGLATKANTADVYTKAETYSKAESYSKAEVDGIADDRTERFDLQLDQRTVAAGRFQGNGTLGRNTSNVAVNRVSAGLYDLTVTSPEACATGLAPVVNVTPVATGPFVLNVVTDVAACTGTAFTVRIAAYDLTTGQAADPAGVLFTAIGTSYPDEVVPPGP